MEASIEELDNLCKEASATKGEIDELEDLVKDKREHLNLLTDKILLLLEAHDKRSWKIPTADIEVRERLTVKTPKTDEEKHALFKWLQEKNIFWQTVNVNSQTLNALYKSEVEACKAEGKEFIFPGVGDPELFKQVIIKRRK